VTTTFRERLAAKPWYKWYALGVLTVVFTSSHVDRQIMAITLQPIKQELGASDTQMGFLVGLTFAVFYATLGMPIAMLADRVNRRNIITAAVTIWSGMTVLCGYAGSFVQLALARIGVGVGEAGSTPPSHSLISDLFPTATRGTAMGIFAIGVYFGLLIAYLAGGVLTVAWGWRAHDRRGRRARHVHRRTARRCARAPRRALAVVARGRRQSRLRAVPGGVLFDR
jgi:MFS family permease